MCCKDLLEFLSSVGNSTSEYLVYWSVMTRAYCPFGNGPQKSTSVIAHGLSGSLVILAGCVCFELAAIWHW